MNNLASATTTSAGTPRPLSSARRRWRFKTTARPRPPRHAHAMNNLANAYFALGRYTDALKLREETLALYKAKLGPDHPDTLRSMSNLAISYAYAWAGMPRPSSSARRRWRFEGQARPRPPRHAY